MTVAAHIGNKDFGVPVLSEEGIMSIPRISFPVLLPAIVTPLSIGISGKHTPPLFFSQ